MTADARRVITVVVWRYDDLFTRRGRRRHELRLPAGATVASLVGQLRDATGPIDLAQVVLVRNGAACPREVWVETPLRQGDAFDVAEHPGDPVSVILLAVGLAISAASALLLQQKIPQSKRGPDRFIFDRFSTDAVAGEPIPIPVGKRVRYGGKVVAQIPVEGVDGESKVKVLIALGHGTVNKIGDQTADFDDLAPAEASGAGVITGVYINDQPAHMFQGVRCWGRLGTTGQQAIPGFGDTEELFEVGVGGALLRNTSGVERTGSSPSGEAFTYTTTQGVNAFTIRMRYARGLYRVSGSGKPRKVRSKWRFRRRRHDVGGGTPGAWTAWEVVETFKAEQNEFFTAYRVDGLLVGDGAWEVQAERVSVESAGVDVADELRWDSLVEIVYSNNRYVDQVGGAGAMALLAVEITANEQLSGNAPRVACELEGLRVRLWDGLSDPDAPVWLPDGYSANNAAVALALLERAEWGLGAQYGLARVDLASLFDWWATCDEAVPLSGGQPGTRPRYRFNYTFSEVGDGWGELLKVCRAGRCTPTTIGNVVHFVQDKPQSIAVETFTDGSIVVEEKDGQPSTAKAKYRKKLTTGGVVPNTLVCQFENEVERGEADTLRYPDVGTLWFDPGYPGGAEPVNEQQVDLPGVTDPEQVMSQLVYQMKKLRAERVSIEFTCSQALVRVQPGERFDLAWSMPGWGSASGRTREGGNDSIVIVPGEFPLLVGVTYTLRLMRQDGTVESRTVIAAVPANGETQIAVSVPFSSAAEPFTEYALGPEDAEAKPFICDGVKISDPTTLTWEISGHEYVEGVHDDTPDEIVSLPSYSSLRDPNVPPGPVLNLTITDQIGPNDRPQVRLAWSQAPIDRAHTARFSIYRRESGEPWQVEAVQPVGREALVIDIGEAQYDFTVVAVSRKGLQISPDAAPSVTSGTAPPPGTTLLPRPTAPVVGYTSTPNGDSYDISWSDFGGVGVAGGAELVGVRVLFGLYVSPTQFPKTTTVLKRVIKPSLGIAGLKLAPGVPIGFYVQYIDEQGRMTVTAVRVIGGTDSPAVPAGESIALSKIYNLSTEGTNTNLAYDAAGDQTRLRTIDPGAVARWTGPIETLASLATTRLRYMMVGGQDSEHVDPNAAQVGAVALRIPSAETDMWFNAPGYAAPWWPPTPDDIVRYTVEVRTSDQASGGDSTFTAWEEMAFFTEIVRSMRRFQFRVTLSRSRYPYRPALQYFAAVATR